MSRPQVVIGLLGTTLDTGKGAQRWERWRPTLSLCQQEDFVVARLELLCPRRAPGLRAQITADIGLVSPETLVKPHEFDVPDPWDFQSVYAALDDFARAYPFDTEKEDYLVHITTGTHVAQICLFLLCESRRIPARLIQTGPRFKPPDPAGEVRIIDLNLARYDAIAARFRKEQKEGIAGLKSGIPTRSPAFNRLIGEVEHVAAHSADPVLLIGPTGAGKSQLAKRIYELKRQRHLVDGPFVEVNCATLRGDTAMSALFGHKKGAYTGAAADRPGLLRSADGGLLFLDEIGELGLDEQAMLLRALEEKRFLPMGADSEVESRFVLLAGTNRDLFARVAAGTFRDDLLARINLWTFELPALRERREDIEPNLDYELDQFAARTNRFVRFSTEARQAYLQFAMSAEGVWPGNFRDLSASITRMATLAQGGRIAQADVDLEVARLRRAWSARPDAAPPLPPGSPAPTPRASGPRPNAPITQPDAPIPPPDASIVPSDASILQAVLGAAEIAALDTFDRVQLAEVLRTCARSASLSEAGRALFAASRSRRSSTNDADRLRKYLARFGLTWSRVRG